MPFRYRHLGLLLLCLSVSFAQQFISEPKDTTAYVGGEVTLNCVLNSGHGSHLWVKDSVLITQEYSPLSHVVDDDDSGRYARYTVIPSETTGYYGYSLHISNVQPQDAGVFQCIVLGGENGLESEKATLQVLAAPEKDYPECSTTTGLHVSVGEEVTFSCQSNGGSPATVLKWLRDFDLTEPSEVSNTHTWTVTENDDQAIFTCQGEHMLWSTPRTCSVGPFKLNNGEPAVKITGLEAIIPQTTATFICSAQYISTPEFSWYIDGNEVRHGDERIIIRDSFGNNAILEIADASVEDNGKSVECKVKYFGGILTSEFAVINVIAAPTRAPTKEPNTIVLDLDDEHLEPRDSGVSSSAIVGATMGIIALVLLVVIFVGIVTIRRAAKKLEGQDENGENFSMRSRYVGVLRSWFFPVHEHTQKSMASFGVGPPMDNKAFEK
ncbi:cell adhesion molecule 2-like [Anneissia japonica]|uniref:cell adhesion molecule 2-like n=1 Tax=Anneissia japonica TaxID=1529436 RepID=UPI001425B0C0|nr:cell adhesion molecule 2-like [Anneissia japonica]